MRLEISEQNLYADCFEGILACVAIYLNRRYEWMYLNEWKFRFEPPPNGTRYRLGLALDLYRNKVGPLVKYHGICYRQYPCENFEKLRDILAVKLAEKMPITVRADAYYCPWDKSYMKYHNPNHIFLINGLQKQTGFLFCSDPFYQEWDRLVSPDEFVTFYAGQYGVFEVTEDVSPLTDGVRIFQTMLESLYVDETFAAIRRLAEAVNMADFMQEIKTDTDIWFSPVYRRMIEIANSRGRLLRLITFVAEQYDQPELLFTLPLLEEIGKEWQQIRSLTLKLLMTCNRTFQDRLAYKIKNTAEMEEKAVITLLNILGG